MNRPQSLCALMVSVSAAVAGLGAAAPVDAATRCWAKTASGTGPTGEVAKFQVYEGLLRSIDPALWASWLTTGATPGYQVGKPLYNCRTMGLGVSCTGRARVCKA